MPRKSRPSCARLWRSSAPDCQQSNSRGFQEGFYLHLVQDQWISKVVSKRSKGQVLFRRYADDSVVCFERLDDAQAYLRALPKRLEKFGLQMAEEKSSLVKKRGTCPQPAWLKHSQVQYCANRPSLHESPPTTSIRSAALCLRVLRGARCGSSARRDLQGGRRATGVPTLIS